MDRRNEVDGRFPDGAPGNTVTGESLLFHRDGGLDRIVCGLSEDLLVQQFFRLVVCVPLDDPFSFRFTDPRERPELARFAVLILTNLFRRGRGRCSRSSLSNGMSGGL